MDMDFEIIDPDDANATIGILAHCGNDLVVPKLGSMEREAKSEPLSPRIKFTACHGT